MYFLDFPKNGCGNKKNNSRVCLLFCVHCCCWRICALSASCTCSRHAVQRSPVCISISWLLDRAFQAAACCQGECLSLYLACAASWRIYLYFCVLVSVCVCVHIKRSQVAKRFLIIFQTRIKTAVGKKKKKLAIATTAASDVYYALPVLAPRTQRRGSETLLPSHFSIFSVVNDQRILRLCSE